MPIHSPTIITNQQAHERILSGFNSLAALLAVTLGPGHGLVLSQRGKADFELLSDAGTIARRFLELPDRAANTGAMLLRNLVWHMNTTVGDGCATAAILAQAMLAAAAPAVAAGAQVRDLTEGMQQAVDCAIDALQVMARPVRDDADLLRVAMTVTADSSLSTVLAEIYGRLGADAAIAIEEYLASYTEREYLPGGVWQGRLAAWGLATTADQRLAECHNGIVVLYEGVVEQLDQVLPLLELVTEQKKPLVLIANRIAGSALQTMVLNQQRGIMPVVAVELRSFGPENSLDFADLAALTGAHLLTEAAGHALSGIACAEFGHTPYVRVSNQTLVIAGVGETAQLTQQLAGLRAQLEATTTLEAAAPLRQRIGRLVGKCAVLKVGANTESERQLRRRQAERAILSMNAVLRHGLLPGGGIAYLASMPTVQDLELDGDYAAGQAAVLEALAAPFYQLLTNAGEPEPTVRLLEVLSQDNIVGYDVIRGTAITDWQEATLDSVFVLIEALRAACSCVRMALTTDVIVLKQRPELSMHP